MDSVNMPYKFNKENTKVKRFWDELENNNIMTTQCQNCHTMHWPPRSFCNKCYSENIDWKDLPSTGKIETFTNVSAPPDGFSKDGYTLGIVTLKNTSLRVFAQIAKTDIELKKGNDVKLHIEEDENKFKYFKIILTD
jgi:hypothetical protein